MARKQKLSAADRRAQLMEIGRSVFAAHGYETTTLDEVARKAGVTKPIIYEHFGSKDGLYAAIVDREMDDLVRRVSISIAEGKPRERFEGAVVAFISYAKEVPAGFAVLIRDSPNTSARRGLTRVIDDLGHRVGDIFRKQFENAGFAPKVAPIYANALIGMVTQVAQWWAADGRGFSLDDVARHVTALGWMGLRHLPRNPASPVGADAKTRSRTSGHGSQSR